MQMLCKTGCQPILAHAPTRSPCTTPWFKRYSKPSEISSRMSIHATQCWLKSSCTHSPVLAQRGMQARGGYTGCCSLLIIELALDTTFFNCSSSEDVISCHHSTAWAAWANAQSIGQHDSRHIPEALLVLSAAIDASANPQIDCAGWQLAGWMRKHSAPLTALPLVTLAALHVIPIHPTASTTAP